MDAAIRDELRMLRARAYGPSADIGDDPAALRRLRELEDLARPGPAAGAASDALTLVAETDVAREFSDTTSPSAAAETHEASFADVGTASGQPTAPEADARSAADARGDGGADESTEPATAADPRERVRLPRRISVLWGASVALAAAVAATVTFAFTAIPPVARDVDAHQVATLEPDPNIEWPPGFFGSSSGALGFEFHGLTLATGGGVFGQGDDECIVAAQTDEIDTDTDTINGQVFYGCSAGAFPATVEFTIDATMPVELRDRFPVGTSLQFLLEGERIGVFTDLE